MNSGRPRPQRGEIWFVYDPAPPAQGHEQAEPRPALVVSADWFNSSGPNLLTIVPLTTQRHESSMHLEIRPPEGGVRRTSFILCEQPTTISHLRLRARWGRVAPATMRQVNVRLRTLLEL
ncbi:MAG TPA: type II toxin-antitoxin system PemK/MazF family toxin [Dehalococcoidia bacterium]|nr:type II toxin-antitoxin system PemK/MazF family toxin [Dehalococcoidia bacterium]